MTPERRRLVALAAALAPGRAAALLLRLADGDAAVALAASLSGAPRRARLATLAATLTGCSPEAPCAGHPLLARLLLEARLGGRRGAEDGLPAGATPSTPSAALTASSSTSPTSSAASRPDAGRTLVRASTAAHQPPARKPA